MEFVTPQNGKRGFTVSIEQGDQAIPWVRSGPRVALKVPN